MHLCAEPAKQALSITFVFVYPWGYTKFMKLSKSAKRTLLFMSSPAGRWARIIGGPLMIAIAITVGGATYLLVPFGVMMFITGTANLCPMGPLYKQSFSGAKILQDVPRYKL